MPTITPMLDAAALAERVHGLADEIRAAHPDQPLVVIAVLKGSFIFLADLARALYPHPVEIDFLGVRSYEGTDSTGQVRITHDLARSLEGRHVLLVEDIVDTGLTLSFLTAALRLRQPASLSVVTLLDKPSRRKVTFSPDFVGFTIPDAFVVGYGLDLDERYRELPFVGIYQP